jgi:hypothetical protein
MCFIGSCSIVLRSSRITTSPRWSLRAGLLLFPVPRSTPTKGANIMGGVELIEYSLYALLAGAL